MNFNEKLWDDFVSDLEETKLDERDYFISGFNAAVEYLVDLGKVKKDALLRDLTNEEKSLEITPARLYDWMETFGESFFDRHNAILSKNVMSGYLLAKYPEIGQEILEVTNEDYSGLVDLEFLIEDYFTKLRPEAWGVFTKDFCDVVNMTSVTKAKVNHVLIHKIS